MVLLNSFSQLVNKSTFLPGFILYHLVPFAHEQRNAEELRPEVRLREFRVRLANEFDILLEIIKGSPSHPAFRFVEVVKNFVIQPKDDILTEPKLNLSDVNMRDSSLSVILAINNQELLPLLEKHDILL